MALQAVEFRANLSANDFIRSKPENLQNLVKAIGNRPVSVVSIVGPSKLNKNLIINSIMRCLVAAEMGIEDWNDPSDHNSYMKGFEMEQATDDTDPTSGICFWPRPFILKNVMGKEFAVIVVNTQALSGTDSIVDKAIIAFCSLLSTVMIFNVSTQNIMNDLRSLEFSSELGSVCAEKTFRRPYQTLRILCGKKNESTDYGDTRQRAVTNQTISTEMSKHQSKLCFQDVNWFSVPYTKLTPAQNKNIDLEINFAVNICSFVESLVGTDIYVRTDSVGPGLLAFVTTFEEMCNAHKPVRPNLEAWLAFLCRWKWFQDCIQFYQVAFKVSKSKYLTEKVFQKLYEEATELLQIFVTDRSLPLHVDRFSKTLTVLVTKELQNLKAVNEKKRNAVRAKAQSTASDIFMKEFVNKLKDKQTSEQEVRLLAKKTKNKAMLAVQDQLRLNESKADILEFWSVLELEFDHVIQVEIERQRKLAPRLVRHEEDNDRDLSCFACPICFEVPNAMKIFQCQNGHVICEACCQSVILCPQCNVEISGISKIRNRAMEAILAKLKILR